MTRRRRIQDGDDIIRFFDEVKHRCDEPTGIERHGFAGFKINSRSRLVRSPSDKFNKEVDIVVVFRDVMTAAEIDPRQSLRKGTERLANGVERTLQHVGTVDKEWK